MYDITSCSYDEDCKRIITLLDQIETLCGHNKPIVLVGNKLDLEQKRYVLKQHVEELVKHSIPVIEGCMKRPEDRKVVLDTIIKMVLAKRTKQEHVVHEKKKCNMM
jgi:GTPase SAR1 family protein